MDCIACENGSNLSQNKAALIRGQISPRTLSGPVKHSGWLQGDKELIITSARECAGENWVRGQQTEKTGLSIA